MSVYTEGPLQSPRSNTLLEVLREGASPAIFMRFDDGVSRDFYEATKRCGGGASRVACRVRQGEKVLLRFSGEYTAKNNWNF